MPVAEGGAPADDSVKMATVRGSAPKQELSLFDSLGLIVGIIIGVGIYQTVPDVARGAGSAGGLLAIWIAGGLLSLCGALGYAELASAYPREGGDYVFLSRAYGSWAGFLFAWLQLTIVRPGDIAVVAFAFATYARAIYDPLGGDPGSIVLRLYAGAAVVLLTAIHILGVRQGRWTQNLLTSVKVLGLLFVAAVAFLGTGHAIPASSPAPEPLPVSVALILVLFTFGGWNEMGYVAAEVRDPRRNIVRSLAFGTLGVTMVYVIANGAFLRALGFQGVAGSEAVASDAVASVFPALGADLVSGLICISALGAVSGMVFTGSRISYAVGADHRPLRWLGSWTAATGTPIRALLLQGGIAVGLIFLLGSFVETILYTATAVYTFYLATSASVIVLRFKEPRVERPYRVTGYPVTTLLFCGACLFLIQGAIRYRPDLASIPFALIPPGLFLYWLSRRRS